MTSPRKTIRNAARSMLAVSTPTRHWTYLPAWSQSIDRDALPVYSVATPRTITVKIDKDSDEDRIDLLVIFKIVATDDLEDLVDDHVAAIVALLLPALSPLSLQPELTLTEINIDGDGAQRVATAVITMTVPVQTPAII